VIDDEQSLGTVGSESLEELRNRILDDQRFRMLLTKSEAALARHELRRAINLMRQAADMQPGVGSEVEHRRISVRLVQTEAELRYRHGQIAESRGDIKGARVHYAAAIKTTGHVAATKSLARLDQAVERRVLIDRGYRASDQGDHLQAIEHLRQAIAMGAGVEVSPLLADAKLAMMLTEARRLTEANDLDAAIDAYTRALRMRPEKPEIGETLVAMRQRQAYTRHLERGDAIAADGQHLAAKMHYRRARSVTASDEIKQRLENAEFNSLITEVRRRLASKDVLGARAMLRTAARTPGGLRQAQTVEELEDRIGADEAP
jgi:tetratricopeptide (TPR) repeat protein